MLATDYASLDALTLLRKFRRGDVQVTEVIEAAMTRINNCDKTIGAILAISSTTLEKAVALADRRYQESINRPLEGVPFVVKDLIDTVDLETTYGSAMFAGHRPPTNAWVVRRLADAGAIVLAKSSTDEFGWGITNANPHFGPTRNPWDPNRVPGGSSGGSAAALAAGYCPLALGTDTAGSIRIPSAFCGVVGLKPTFGSVSMSGIFSMCPSLDHVGPMARTAADAALLYEALTSRRISRVPERQKIALINNFGGREPEPEIQAAVATAAEIFASDSHNVCEAEFSVNDLYQTLATVVLIESAAGHRLTARWPQRAAEFGSDVQARLRLADQVTPNDYLTAQRTRTNLRSRVLEMFDSADVLLCATSSVQPISIDRIESPEGNNFRADVMEFTALASLTGLPALTVCSAISSDGLPIGVQMIGRPGAEPLLLSLAAELEALNPTHPGSAAWPSEGQISQPHKMSRDRPLEEE